VNGKSLSAAHECSASHLWTPQWRALANAWAQDHLK